MLSIRYWIYNVWWFSTVYTALNVSYFFEARRGRLRGSLRECSIHVSRVDSRLSSVTKIKMYASRTHRESTSGEVEACHINHPPLKISSSVPRGGSRRCCEPRSNVLLRVSQKKKCTLVAAGELVRRKNLQVDPFSVEISSGILLLSRRDV